MLFSALIGSCFPDAIQPPPFLVPRFFIPPFTKTALESSEGHIYAWGCAIDGRLGTGERREGSAVPSIVRGLQRIGIIAIASGGAQNAALTGVKSSINGYLAHRPQRTGRCSRGDEANMVGSVTATNSSVSFRNSWKTSFLSSIFQ